MNKKFKEIIKTKNQKERKELFIGYWLCDFPCEEYFGTKEKCINEFLTIKELNQFIEKKCLLKKK